MKRRLFTIMAALIGVGLGYPRLLMAHRLDELLQAARIDINRDVVNVELDLTPGVEVAAPIIAHIDTNHDGRISDEEGRVYANEVIRSTYVALDGHPLEFTLTNERFPQVQELSAGLGTIRLTAASKLPAGTATGSHELFYRNLHQREISIYLANALVPSDSRVQISGQRRDYSQHELTIDYRIAEENMKGLLKLPLILAAVVTILRVVVERAGAPDAVANLFSVVAIHLLLAPLYFAIRIAQSPEIRPYATQFKLTFLFVVLARAIVLPTYWLGYVFQWQQNRFAGLIGASAFRGIIAEPLMTAAIWIVMSTIFGGVIGCVVIAIWRRVRRPSTANAL